MLDLWAAIASLEAKLSEVVANQAQFGTSLINSETSLESTCVQLDTIGSDARHCCRTGFEMFCLSKASATAVGMDVTSVGDCPDCPCRLVGC